MVTGDVSKGMLNIKPNSLIDSHGFIMFEGSRCSKGDMGVLDEVWYRNSIGEVAESGVWIILRLKVT